MPDNPAAIPKRLLPHSSLPPIRAIVAADVYFSHNVVFVIAGDGFFKTATTKSIFGKLCFCSSSLCLPVANIPARELANRTRQNVA